MSVPIAYAGVIIIWSTTPLAIQWSGAEIGFLFGVTSRMLIGAVVCIALLPLLRIPMPWHKTARQTYLAAGLGIYLAMLSVHWSAQHIPSGWISVLFGLAPIITGIMTTIWLNERALTPVRVGGMALGVAGLYLIFGSGRELGPHAVMGVGAMLFAVFIHSASAVRIKFINADVPALALTAGGLLIATPLFMLTWWVFGNGWPAAIPPRTAGAIIYLGLFGSVLGFMLYFYALKTTGPMRVALLTLITPVTALLLGHWLNGEAIDGRVWAGALAIMAALVFYQLAPRIERTFTLAAPADDD